MSVGLIFQEPVAYFNQICLHITLGHNEECILKSNLVGVHPYFLAVGLVVGAYLKTQF